MLIFISIRHDAERVAFRCGRVLGRRNLSVREALHSVNNHHPCDGCFSWFAMVLFVDFMKLETWVQCVAEILMLRNDLVLNLSRHILNLHKIELNLPTLQFRVKVRKYNFMDIQCGSSS